MCKLKAKTYVHVNQHVIKKNKKDGETNPPLTAKRGKSGRSKKAKVIIGFINNEEVFRVVYQPDKPLPCGATCWVEFDDNVRLEYV